MTETPNAEHQRPDGLADSTVKALGKLSEALEMVEEARGRLYGFHRLTGAADLALGEAVDLLKRAGHTDLADGIAEDLLGRNVLQGAGRSSSLRSTTTGITEHSNCTRKRHAHHSLVDSGTCSKPT